MRARFTARTADKHLLYERAVQDPASDLRFVRKHFERRRDRDLVHLREDFCGTAAICAEWVSGRADRTALGLDLDAPTLAYGQRRLDRLGDAGSRAKLLHQNVLDSVRRKVDVILAFNSSYCVFQDRRTLLEYFRKARAGLVADGAFFLDCQGGHELAMEVIERTRVGGFTYVWEQLACDAVSGRAERYIHFEFPDGSKLRRAFHYDWRLWTLHELRELLLEAGFSAVDIYWEGTDANGGGNGVFRLVERVENERSYVAWLIAWR